MPLISVSLSHCIFLLNTFCIGLGALAVNPVFAFLRFLYSKNGLAGNPKMSAADVSRVSAAHGGNSRTYRHAVVAIRRVALSHPPAISAENLQNLHKMRILRIFCITF
jgi:hypothetical protein